MSPQTPVHPSSSMRATAYGTSLYFLSVASLYLWGYWSAFEVNIFEYVSLSDVLKTAVFPIASVFVFVALGVVVGEALFPHGFMPPGGSKNTAVGKFLNRIGPAVGALYVGGLAALLVFGPTEKWRVLPLLIAIPVSLTLKEAGLLREEVKSDSARSVLIFLLSTLPAYAYGHGILKANDLRTGKAFSFVDSPLDGVSKGSDAPANKKPRYVGRAGQTYFLFDPVSKGLLIVPESQIKLIQLKLYRSESHPVIKASLPAASNANSPAIDSPR